MIKSLKLTAAAMVAASTLVATPAYAEEEAAGPFDISANVSVVSDYRFRGVSLNEEDVVVQGGIDLSYALSDSVSLYVGEWNSTLEDDVGYGDSEIDIYGGFTGSAGKLGWKLGGIAYLYPDAKNVDYYELNAELNGEIGPLTMAVGTFIAPSQKNFGSKTGVYLYTSAGYSIPNTPVSLKATIGYEDNAYFNSKIDWSLGASVNYKVFTFGVAYLDTNRHAYYLENNKIRDGADGTIVLNVTAAF